MGVPNRHAMIMAGGAGTRLWPVSRGATPKQLAALIGDRSLLEIAAARLDGLIPPERVWICAGETHREAVRAALPGFSDERFLGEPMGRDTVNAVAFGAAVIERVDPGASVCVLTADHLIEPEAAFRACVDRAFALVEEDAKRLVTFSIRPSFPATGYGYIERADAIAGHPGAHRVAKYVEKPDLETAQQYVDSGRFGWNSGMFVWRAATALDALDAYKPESAAGARRIAEAWGTAGARAVIDEVYPSLPKISVDYALMEPASADDRFEVCTVVADVSWKDVGSWAALAETIDADALGNRVGGVGEATLVDCRETLAFSSQRGHRVAALGCEGLIIVHTKDATLVMPREHAERLKELHGELPDALK